MRSTSRSTAAGLRHSRAPGRLGTSRILSRLTAKFAGAIVTSMKKATRSLCLRIVAIALALSFGLSAYAETPRESMVHAYRLMKKADHDYDGHRVKAMEHLEVAGKALGLELKGDLGDKERQWKSDAQLAEARKLLRNAAKKLERADRDRVADHVDLAIKEIDLALKVK